MADFQKFFTCSCGKVHNALLDDYIVGKGAIREIASLMARYGATKPYLIADRNTYQAAGKQVCKVLDAHNIPYSLYVFSQETIHPNEEAVGSAAMHYDVSCDMVIGIGSGVINDIGKLISKLTKTPYIIVATAPSMDGYASATSSMDVDGLKTSVPSRCANVIVGDLDVLRQAPVQMLVSGLGDMLAKYVSICEWRIAHLITGEYYCPTVAEYIRKALKKCVDHAEGLLNREEEAVRAVFEGLIIGGVAMNYAGLSRPASGVEHYFSHVWDMRALEFGMPASTHGIQCALGTLYALRIYEQVKKYTPDVALAEQKVSAFDHPSYNQFLKDFLGRSAESMLALEEKEGKYDPVKHHSRIAYIAEHWQELVQIMEQELPAAAELERLLKAIGAPCSVEEIGLSADILRLTFEATKDIRDKYVLSRLCWDLGILEDIQI
ncbi:MAG: sn-glycerol-1-phosphate dehydrogenase [Oscillospiraceae bacterium]|nr:sn-glycerol-1-phosphate dehydrogenase [Oscillospiraceae bacterium]